MFRFPPAFTTFLALGGLTCSVAAADIPWKIDRLRSTIDVSVHSTFNSFVCHVDRFEADVALKETRQIEHAVVRFDAGDIRTGRPQRDAHLLEWMDNGSFGQVSFALTETHPSAEGGLIVRGLVTLHGVERAVTFPARVLVQGRLQSIDGEAMLDYRDFGLPILRKFYVLTVDPHLAVRFHLQGWLDASLHEGAVSAN